MNVLIISNNSFLYGFAFFTACAIFFISILTKNRPKKNYNFENEQKIFIKKPLLTITTFVFYIITHIWLWGVLLYLFSFRLHIFGEITLLIQLYGLTALFLIYSILLLGLGRAYFPNLKIITTLIDSRRTLGLNAYLFLIIHFFLAFIIKLHGNVTSITHVSFGLLALFIFSLLAVTSVDWVIKVLHYKRWKLIHNSIYLGTFFLLLYAILNSGDFWGSNIIIENFIIFLTFLILWLKLGTIFRNVFYQVALLMK